VANHFTPRGTQKKNQTKKCRDQCHVTPIPIFLQSVGTNTNSFVFFFNRKLTEGPIPIFLQSTGTNSKQKKV